MERQLDMQTADHSNTYTEQREGEIRVSVRRLVEFILRSGDIDNRHQAGSENAMQEGSRIHRMLQKRMGSDYMAEVSLKTVYALEEYDLVIEGRADGIIDQPGKVMIDEIKGTYRDLDHLRQPLPEHIAQAKCYAYMYALQKEHKSIQIRMTYCNIETEDIRYFYEEYSFEELQQWFLNLMNEYRKWADFTWNWRKIRQESLRQMEFPFPYREGQRELVSYVYQTIYHKKKLFVEAPTGVGKTISTIFPSLKAIERGMGDKLFYLTAKTITRTVADDAIELLRAQNLKFKSIVLTAKEKICFQEHMECNPEHCLYAKGHYDRINDAIYDLLSREDRFSREKIEEYAVKHRVCPFEMALDMSLFADAIICDYNYLFDPHIYLKRFFETGGGNYLFLIDEAHNLLERGREMYSAGLVKENFLLLKREIHSCILEETGGEEDENMDPKGKNGLPDGQISLEMTGVSLDASNEKKAKKKRRKKKGKSIFVRDGYADKISYHLEACNKQLLLLKRECEGAKTVEEIDGFVNALLRLYNAISDYLEVQEEETLILRDEILEFYFEISHFLEIYELVDEHYRKYTRICEDGSFLVKLFCVNPGENLKKCMMRGRSTILFSATMLPIQYYKELLGGEKEDYEVYAKSVFDKEKQMLFIADDVTSKYTRRTRQEYVRIAEYIHRIVAGRTGNYLVFCPSYAFMKEIHEILEEEFPQEHRECLIQQETMAEEDREAFLARFRGNRGVDFDNVIQMEVEIEETEETEDAEDTVDTLVGFCVLGGIFGEGIDLKNDSLIGAIIVGTGLPQVCFERELLKEYFDRRGESGFDYAYRYPGMNKVLQAAGRVIRTQDDVGIVALLDERFLQGSYRKLFPREWEQCEVIGLPNLEKKLERFWDSWGKYSG